ncbi:MAG: SulP family inorganic anion transporter [Crocinitomicaceae bacterium]|nr:SulP family inorganic anion transporter [Crocinitomicaceae bacterium]
MKNLFDFKNFKGDLFGGITAGIVALPLALAFGLSSGLGPSAGLYGAIFVAFFAALFGGTNTQISGPTAPMTATSMLVIAGIVAANDNDIEKALPAILMVFLLAGLLQVGMGFVGVGKYIKYIPVPVVSGFMTAIGVIIIITQLLPVVGYYPSEDQALIDKHKPLAEEMMLEQILHDEMEQDILVLEDFDTTIYNANQITPEHIQEESIKLTKNEGKTVIGAIKYLPRALGSINWMELILAFSTIFVIYAFKRVTSAIPSTLVALVLVSGIAYGFDLTYRPIEEIPSGLPVFHMDIFSNFSLGAITPYLFSAVMLALLGAIDSLLTSVVADNMTKTKHNPNKELVGQGIGNSIAAMFGGIPGAGATIRTVVNIKAGGKTRLSGMMAGVLLLIILLGIGPIASKIPAAVLAGILVTVGIGVMDYKGLKAMPKMPKTEVLVMLTVLILASVWNLIYAVGIGLILASLFFMKKMGDLTAEGSNIKAIDDDDLIGQGLTIPENLKEEVYVKLLNGPLFFGSTSDIQELYQQMPETATTVIIRMGRVSYIDQSGLYLLDDMLLELRSKEITVLLVGLQDQPRYMMERVDIIPDLVSDTLLFDNFIECSNWVKENVEDVY